MLFLNGTASGDAKQPKLQLLKTQRKISLKISFRPNNFITNNIPRSLIIFGIDKIDLSYCLSSNILALLSKSHFQSKTSFVHKKLNI